MKKSLAPLMTSASGDWGTPVDFYNQFNNVFDFQLDAAASDANALCPRWLGGGGGSDPYSWFVDSFDFDWHELADRIWLNPPYGSGLNDWMVKCADESKKGALIVALLPARTDTGWFETVWDNAAALFFVRGRLKFRGAPASAPFPSVVAVFDYAKRFGGGTHLVGESLWTVGLDVKVTQRGKWVWLN